MADPTDVDCAYLNVLRDTHRLEADLVGPGGIAANGSLELFREQREEIMGVKGCPSLDSPAGRDLARRNDSANEEIDGFYQQRRAVQLVGPSGL